MRGRDIGSVKIRLGFQCLTDLQLNTSKSDDTEQSPYSPHLLLLMDSGKKSARLDIQTLTVCCSCCSQTEREREREKVKIIERCVK